MTLIVLNITKTEIKGKDFSEYTEYILELSDGYCSLFSLIKINNPINLLLQKNKIYIGVKLDIISAQYDADYSKDNKHYINMFYNSISKSNPKAKLVILLIDNIIGIISKWLFIKKHW